MISTPERSSWKKLEQFSVESIRQGPLSYHFVCSIFMQKIVWGTINHIWLLCYRDLVSIKKNAALRNIFFINDTKFSGLYLCYHKLFCMHSILDQFLFYKFQSANHTRCDSAVWSISKYFGCTAFQVAFFIIIFVSCCFSAFSIIYLYIYLYIHGKQGITKLMSVTAVQCTVSYKPDFENRLIDKINKRIAGNEKFFSLQFFPPRTRNGTCNLFEKCDRLSRGQPLFCDVTCDGGSDRSNAEDVDESFGQHSLDVATTTQSITMCDTMLRLNASKLTEDSAHKILTKAKDHGLSTVMAVAESNCFLFVSMWNRFWVLWKSFFKSSDQNRKSEFVSVCCFFQFSWSTFYFLLNSNGW